jgi:hypothetical protein
MPSAEHEFYQKLPLCEHCNMGVVAPKPIVLHLGDAIKYNHDFYRNEFQSRFDVIQATETDRESFIQALKTKK